MLVEPCEGWLPAPDGPPSPRSPRLSMSIASRDGLMPAAPALAVEPARRVGEALCEPRIRRCSDRHRSRGGCGRRGHSRWLSRCECRLGRSQRRIDQNHELSADSRRARRCDRDLNDGFVDAHRGRHAQGTRTRAACWFESNPNQRMRQDTVDRNPPPSGAAMTRPEAPPRRQSLLLSACSP